MKYTFELEIDAPYTTVMGLLDDPDNLSKWQPELQSYLVVVGDYGQVGSQTHLTYNVNARPFEMIQSVTARDLPNELSSRFETAGMVMRVTNRFADIGPESTFWRCETEFEFTNFVMKLIGYFMGQNFRDHTWKSMNLFKRFAEASHSS